MGEAKYIYFTCLKILFDERVGPDMRSI